MKWNIFVVLAILLFFILLYHSIVYIISKHKGKEIAARNQRGRKFALDGLTKAFANLKNIGKYEFYLQNSEKYTELGKRLEELQDVNGRKNEKVSDNTHN